MKISLLADCPADVPAVARWYFDEWAHYDPDMTPAILEQKVALDLNRTTVPLGFVVHIDDDLAGAGEIKLHDFCDYPDYQYWLDGIYVADCHRGKGVSTVLINYGIRKARELGLPALYLRCIGRNVSLYESHGFRVMNPDEDKFIMGLVITPL